MNRKWQTGWDGMALPKLGYKRLGLCLERLSGVLFLSPSRSSITSWYVERTIGIHRAVQSLPAIAGISLEENRLRFAEAAVSVSSEVDALVFEMVAALTSILIATEWESQGPIVSNQAPDLGIADRLELWIPSSLESSSSYNKVLGLILSFPLPSGVRDESLFIYCQRHPQAFTLCLLSVINHSGPFIVFLQWINPLPPPATAVSLYSLYK